MTLQHHALNSFRNSTNDTLWVTNKFCKGKDSHEKCQGRWTWPDSNLQIVCLCKCHKPNINDNDNKPDKKIICAKIANIQQHEQSALTRHITSNESKRVATTVDITEQQDEVQAGPKVILGLSGYDILSGIEHNYVKWHRSINVQAYMYKFVEAKKNQPLGSRYS
jgi:hypothetical protein